MISILNKLVEKVIQSKYLINIITKLNIHITHLYNKLVAIILIIIAALSSTSCSDDEYTSSGGHDEFLEVNVDGKTFRKAVDFTSVSFHEEYAYINANIEPVGLYMWFHRDLNLVAKLSTGEYRMGDVDGVEIFDLNIDYERNYKTFYSESGTHIVTSIQKYGDKVYVQGTFDGILNDGTPICGKYRIALWA